MNSPTYSACGGVVFVQEHRHVSLERASIIESVHRSNAAFWQSTDQYSEAARRELARVETTLADEMAEAIRAATHTQLEQAA